MAASNSQESNIHDSEKFMRQALQQAELAYGIGEVPVGCVFVYQGRVVAAGRNNTNITNNATRHAEFEALDRMFQCKEPLPLSIMAKTDLYVTVEPCLMCASALGWMGIRHVYYGCANDKFGGCGSIFTMHDGVTGGILKNEAIMMLRRFYIRENNHAPNPRKKAHRVLKQIVD